MQQTRLGIGVVPRMQAWNTRQMAISALTSKVLTETGFGKIGLICHSQGMTEAFVALAKEQRQGATTGPGRKAERLPRVLPRRIRRAADR
ncbi:hypothetical protein RJ55_04397 [Drechmeria coniospora]|nr:hypothetical protein RJ55_04397 [Drechmeria coniospora]